VGHRAAACPSPKKERAPGGGGYGGSGAAHSGRTAAGPRSASPAPGNCYNCGKAGHYSKECPLPQKPRGGGGGGGAKRASSPYPRYTVRHTTARGDAVEGEDEDDAVKHALHATALLLGTAATAEDEMPTALLMGSAATAEDEMPTLLSIGVPYPREPLGKPVGALGLADARSTTAAVDDEMPGLDSLGALHVVTEVEREERRNAGKVANPAASWPTADGPWGESEVIPVDCGKPIKFAIGGLRERHGEPRRFIAFADSGGPSGKRGDCAGMCAFVREDHAYGAPRHALRKKVSVYGVGGKTPWMTGSEVASLSLTVALSGKRSQRESDAGMPAAVTEIGGVIEALIIPVEMWETGGWPAGVSIIINPAAPQEQPWTRELWHKLHSAQAGVATLRTHHYSVAAFAPDVRGTSLGDATLVMDVPHDARCATGNAGADDAVACAAFTTGEEIDPTRFDPDRFGPGPHLTPDGSPRPRGAFFPFGDGQRKCIGEHFAKMEARIILSVLASRFTFTPLPGHRVETDPSVTLRPRGGLPIQLGVRQRGE